MTTSTEKDRSNNPPAPQKIRFTIRSIMVITLIMAVAAAAAGRLASAANSGQLEQIGPFVIATSMAPLGLMIVVSWFLRLANK